MVKRILLLLFCMPSLYAMDRTLIKQRLEQLLSTYYKSTPTKKDQEKIVEKEAIAPSPAVPPSPPVIPEMHPCYCGLSGAVTVLTILLLQHTLRLVWYKHESAVGIGSDMAIAAGFGYAWAILAQAHMPKNWRTTDRWCSTLIPAYVGGIGGIATAMTFDTIMPSPKGYTYSGLWKGTMLGVPLFVGAIWYWLHKK